MALSRCALRFHRCDRRVGLDSVLAFHRGGASGCDFLAREISEGAKIVFDRSARMAILDGVCGSSLASSDIRERISLRMGGKETLIEQRLPQDLARWQPRWRYEMVPERRLFARRKAHHVFSRISTLLPA